MRYILVPTYLFHVLDGNGSLLRDKVSHRIKRNVGGGNGRIRHTLVLVPIQVSDNSLKDFCLFVVQECFDLFITGKYLG